MLVRPDGLERIGGIGAIRGALIDDCALAAKIKGSGGRIRLDVTREAWSIREYRTAGSIWAMIARTAYTQLHYSPLLLAGTLLGLGVTYLAPPLLVLFCIGAARLVGLGVWLAMAVAFWPTIRLYRLNPVWTLALPGIAAFYARRHARLSDRLLARRRRCLEGPAPGYPITGQSAAIAFDRPLVAQRRLVRVLVELALGAALGAAGPSTGRA